MLKWGGKVTWGIDNVNGEITHPGDYEFQPKLTLKELVEKAGGITPTAFLKRAEVSRVLDDHPAESGRSAFSVSMCSAKISFASCRSNAVAAADRHA